MGFELKPRISQNIVYIACYRRRYRLAVLVTVLFCFLQYHNVLLPRLSGYVASSARFQHAKCPDNPLAKDILVVMRTGATEIHHKLPTHLDTTLRCVPDLVIYSDYGEKFAGREIHNVFQGVNTSVFDKQPEFEHYRHLQEHGREGLDIELHLGSSVWGSDNIAWKLDRFKFLPMVDKALKYRPNATWYVFIETDTYLIWSNLFDFLGKANASEALYLGRQMFIGDVEFGHGGAGFMITNSAMRRVTEHWKAHLAEWDEYTARSWAGDMVLGKAMKDVGAPLTQRWPDLEGNSVSLVDFLDKKGDNKMWCRVPATFHHMHSQYIKEFYAFEQSWRRRNSTALLHIKDIFRGFMAEKMKAEVQGWDNMSGENEKDMVKAKSSEDCRAVCESQPDCLQYSHVAGNCSTATRAKHGREPKEGQETIRSGWMMGRIEELATQTDSLCH